MPRERSVTPRSRRRERKPPVPEPAGAPSGVASSDMLSVWHALTLYRPTCETNPTLHKELFLFEIVSLEEIAHVEVDPLIPLHHTRVHREVLNPHKDAAAASLPDLLLTDLPKLDPFDHRRDKPFLTRYLLQPQI